MRPLNPTLQRWGLGLLLVSVGCAEGSNQHATMSPDAATTSTFSQIQRRIFDRQCGSCHGPKGVGARETGLFLHEAESAYRGLIGATPTNMSARRDALYRVMPRDHERSLLWHKLQWQPDHHAGRHYGNPMPLGGESLTIGELDFIYAWIREGAPRHGVVADSSLLNDKRKPFTEPFRPLAMPARGYQIRIDSFGVPARSEREVMVYRRVGNPTEVFVNRIETRVRVNSHHLLVMAFRDSTPAYIVPQHDVVRDIRAANGLIYSNLLVMSWHDFFAGSGTQYENRQLPAGVALRLPAHASLDMNSHYVNRGVRSIPGEVHVNLHTVPREQVRSVVRSLTIQNDTFQLPAAQRSVVTTDHRFRGLTHLVMLTTHTHELAEKFVISILGGPRDGEIVYTSLDWRTPAVVWFDHPIVLRAGEGLRSVVTYNNTRSLPVRHGPTALDEMNVIRAYWY